MLTHVSINEVMSGEPIFASPDGTATFWKVSEHDHGLLWVGRFSGTSPWERHPADELIHVVEGAVEITSLGALLTVGFSSAS